jgi:hypothetical protein
VSNNQTAPEGTKRLILHVEVPEIYVDDLPGYVAEGMGEGEEATPEDYAVILTNEWVRETVGLTLVTIPGEMTGADEFDIESHNGRIVGIEIKDREVGW